MKNIYLSNTISYIFGQFSFWIPPKILCKFIIYVFTKLLQIDLSTSTNTQFSSLNDMFTRELNPSERPWDGQDTSFCSPVDGTLIDSQIIKQQSFHVKNVTYQLSDLIGSTPSAEFEHGQFLNIYLSPKDCHRIFSPCDLDITEVRYIPGALLPVSPLVTRFVKHIFSTNERLVIHATYQNCPFIMVLVGALNVGHMTIETTAGFATNRRKDRLQKLLDITKQHFKKGDHLATFNLGSTVLLFFPKDFIVNNSLLKPKAIQYGECIARF